MCRNLSKVCEKSKITSGNNGKKDGKVLKNQSNTYIIQNMKQLCCFIKINIGGTEE